MSESSSWRSPENHRIRSSAKFSVKFMIEHTPYLPAVFEGLRKAGLPEE
jgi:hypothetical protein